MMSSSDLPKFINRADINWAYFQKIKYILKKPTFSKNFTGKSWSPNLIFFIEKKSESFCCFLMLKKDFESQNFAIFEEVVRNFDRSDEDIIYSEKMLISMV